MSIEPDDHVSWDEWEQLRDERDRLRAEVKRLTKDLDAQLLISATVQDERCAEVSKSEKLEKERDALRAEHERLKAEQHELRKRLAWIDGDRIDAEKERDALRVLEKAVKNGQWPQMNDALAAVDALREAKP